MEWQETAFPVPVHVAAIMGDVMVKSRAKTVVMDKNRRMLQTKLYLYFRRQCNLKQSTWIFN